MQKLIFLPMMLLSSLLGSGLYANGCDHNISQQRDSLSLDEYNYGTLSPDAPKETLEFGQLVGFWDCISKDLVEDENGKKKWYVNQATWKWEYILGGHAILNQWWQEDNSHDPITKEYFASGMFIYNPKTNLWEMVIMNSRRHKLSPKFQASYYNAKIRVNDETGKWQITFFDIEKESFEWKYEVRAEDGSWQSISEISARRMRQNK